MVATLMSTAATSSARKGPSMLLVGSTRLARQQGMLSWGSAGKLPTLPLRTAGLRRRHPGGRTQARKPACSSDPDDRYKVVEKDGSIPEELQFGAADRSPPVRTGRVGAPQSLQPGDSLHGGRYEVIDVIGTGSNGVTYRALTKKGKEVAVKMLSLRGMNDWKQLQLFEREASTLRALNHPAIAKYIDYFEEESDDNMNFFLVQELAPGRSLAEVVKEGRLFTEEEISKIAKQLLDVLNYLGKLRPPVVHRDVKPENIMLDGDKVWLVDFGGVQEASLLGEGMQLGSTIIGTYGYMAPEQFRGAAQPASDLYALGGTLLYLLSGLAPSAFPQSRLRIDFKDRVTVGRQMEELLTGLLEPLPEDRFTAKEAIDLLEGRLVRRKTAEVSAAPSRGKEVRRPAGTRVTVKKEGRSTFIDIPPNNPGSNLGESTFALTWNLFVAYWTVSALAGGGIIFAAFSAPFWVAGVGLLKSSFGSFLTRSSLEITPSTWKLSKELALLKGGVPSFGGDNSAASGGETIDLSRAEVTVNGYVNGEAQTELTLFNGIQKFEFAEGLTFQEQVWLAGVINEAIERSGAGSRDSRDDDDYWSNSLDDDLR